MERQKENYWRLYCDGASRGNPGQAAVGAVLFGPESDSKPLLEISEAIGKTTNNVAEYKALITGLEQSLALRRIQKLDILLDSELIVRQLDGRYKVKDAKMRPLYQKSKELLAKFKFYHVQHIPRQENKHADRLANQALDQLS